MNKIFKRTAFIKMQIFWNFINISTATFYQFNAHCKKKNL